MKLNLLREYLQACVLRSLHESEAFSALSFVGGTALHVLFNLPRFSEDLDFSLEDSEGYRPRDWLAKLQRDLAYLKLEADLAWNDRKTVHVAWVRVGGVLEEAGVTSNRKQKLALKLEIDTRPPRGARFERSLVNRHLLFAIRHHDLPSLLAGKIHALMTRPFTKGRDWYDLVWYRARRPPTEPNRTLLDSALAQSGVRGSGDWRSEVLKAARSVDFDAARRDVAPFLERREEAEFLSLPRIETLLGTTD